MAWRALLIAIPMVLQVVFAEYNFTYAMAHRCKEHLSTGGYHYGPFYAVSSPPASDSGLMFEMHIAVLAASNGHILLSSLEKPGPSDPVYEIVLGGGANKFSELRRMQRRYTKTSEKTVGILSPVHFRAFWIRVSDDGSVDVGKEGESIPILHWLDPDPLSVNYFSFASWTNVEAKFLYECPVAGDDAAENVTQSEVVAPRLTTAQRLKVDLLGERSPLTPPSPRVTVGIGITVASVQYDAVGSVLETLVGIVLSWKDEKIAWDPDKYNGTTQLIFRQGEIWKPQFYLVNSVGIGAIQSKTAEPVYIISSGVAVMHIRTKLSSWCEDTSHVLSAWPRDQYNCPLVIGAWEMHEEVQMEILEVSQEESIENLKENKLIMNEWDLSYTGYRFSPVSHSPYINVTCIGDEYPTQNSELVLRLDIRRKGAFNVVLYTPLLTMVAFLLLSFWTEPLAAARVWFYSGATVLLCALLSYIDAIIPGHSLPSIVVLYEVVLLTTLLAMIVQLVLMHPALGTSLSTGRLPSLMSHKLLRLLCCLQPVKSYTSFGSEGEELEPPELSERPSTSSELGVQLTSCALPSGSARAGTAAAADRLMFAVYSILFAALLASHY